MLQDIRVAPARTDERPAGETQSCGAKALKHVTTGAGQTLIKCTKHTRNRRKTGRERDGDEEFFHHVQTGGENMGMTIHKRNTTGENVGDVVSAEIFF